LGGSDAAIHEALAALRGQISDLKCGENGWKVSWSVVVGRMIVMRRAS